MTAQKSRLLLVVCLLFLCFLPAAAASIGSISGGVTDPTGAVITGAKVTVTTSSGFTETVFTSPAGRFKLDQVPAETFTLTVEAPGFSPSTFAGELNGANLIHDIHFKSITQAQHVEVKGEDNSLKIGPSMTHHDIEDDEIEKMPIAPSSRAMSAVIESVPGTFSEENGRIHVRGSETQPQYVLDGIPLADNLSGTFATGLDTENLRSTQIVTGNIPAEFGDKVAAVVNINSKSGLDAPWHGSLALSAGSFGSRGADTEVAGHVRKLGVFLTADGNGSDRFLDPPEIQNFHNRGGLVHMFSRFDLLATSNDVLRLTLSTNGSNFQVPNRLEQEQTGQRQRQELRDDFEALNWNHVFNTKTVSDLALFRRSSSSRLLDPQQTGEPFFLEQNRRQRTEGMRASLSTELPANSLKFGVEVYRNPLQESFLLAVTDPGEVDPTEPIAAFTVDQPFAFREKKTGMRESAYVQDHIRIVNNLTADLGLRVDHYDLLFQQSAVSPRTGVAYHFTRTDTVIRASYNRLYETPPLENLLLSSSPQAAQLSSVNPDSFARVPAERQNSYEAGLQQQIGKYLQLDITRYVKNIRNFSDDQQLFATAVVFPVAIRGADIRGTEVRIDLKPFYGWTAYASYANMRATANGPLVGGLFLGHEDDKLEGAGSKFAADQDEHNEAQFGVTYNHRSGAWASFTGRYDSGIPTDFDPGDFSGFDPRIQAQLDPSRLRIKPRTLLGAAAGIELRRETRFPIALQISANNLTDQFYLYNFQSVFSGTHIGRPRDVVGRIVFRWNTKQ